MILIAPFKIYEDKNVSTKPVVFRRVKAVPLNPFKPSPIRIFGSFYFFNEPKIVTE